VRHARDEAAQRATAGYGFEHGVRETEGKGCGSVKLCTASLAVTGLQRAGSSWRGPAARVAPSGCDGDPQFSLDAHEAQRI
jgi:hypothetical protein